MDLTGVRAIEQSCGLVAQSYEWQFQRSPDLSVIEAAVPIFRVAGVVEFVIGCTAKYEWKREQYAIGVCWNGCDN